MSVVPTWSVMVPTYRCNPLLVQCLASILAQDLGPDRMQIAVVNDDPDDAECACVVASAAPGRIEYHRNPRNLGNGATFNRCIALARNELVAIVHGDDFLLPGYFEKLSTLAAANPDAGIFACRAHGVDSAGQVTWTSQRYPTFEQLSHDDSPLWESLHLMPAAVVIRRDVYARIGGFREDLPNGQDWEMWARAIRKTGIVMLPETLAAYRQHGDSVSGRTKQTARNIRDFAWIYRNFAELHPAYPLATMFAGLRGIAYSQALEYERRGNREAAEANWQAWCEITPLHARVLTYVKRFAKKCLRREPSRL